MTTKEYDTLVEELNVLKKQLTDVELERDLAKGKLAEACGDLQKVKPLLTEYESDNTSLKKSLERLTVSLDKMTIDHRNRTSELTNRCTLLETKFAQLEERFNATTQEKIQLQDAIDDLKRTNSTLEKTCASASEQNCKLVYDNNEMRQRGNDDVRMINNLRNDLETITRQKKKFMEEMSEYKSNCEKQLKGKAELEENKLLNDKVLVLNDKIKEMKEQIEGYNKINTSLKNELLQKKTDFQKLKEENSELERKLKEAVDRLELSNQQLDKMYSEFRTELTDVQSEPTGLATVTHQDLDKLEKEHQQLKDERKRNLDEIYQPTSFSK